MGIVSPGYPNRKGNWRICEEENIGIIPWRGVVFLITMFYIGLKDVRKGKACLYCFWFGFVLFFLSERDRAMITKLYFLRAFQLFSDLLNIWIVKGAWWRQCLSV